MVGSYFISFFLCVCLLFINSRLYMISINIGSGISQTEPFKDVFCFVAFFFSVYVGVSSLFDKYHLLSC